MKNRVVQCAIGFLHLGIGLLFFNFFESLLNFSGSFDMFLDSFSQISDGGHQAVQRLVFVFFISFSSTYIFVQSVFNFKSVKYSNYLFSISIILLLCSSIYFFFEGESL